MSNRKRIVAAQAAPPPEIAPEPPQSLGYPTHWVKGQLLDLKKYTDGSAMAVLLGEQYDPQAGNAVHFASLHEAQQFVSHWYAREQQLR